MPPFWIFSPLWRQFLPWSKNDLCKSCSPCEALSNVLYRFSLACVVFEILDSVCLCADIFNLSTHKMALREFLNMSDWSETSQKVFSHGFTPYPALRWWKIKSSKISVTLVYILGVSSGQSRPGARGYFGHLPFRQHFPTPRWYLTRSNGVMVRPEGLLAPTVLFVCDVIKDLLSTNQKVGLSKPWLIGSQLPTIWRYFLEIHDMYLSWSP